jgi:hypothetical protein
VPFVDHSLHNKLSFSKDEEEKLLLKIKKIDATYE